MLTNELKKGDMIQLKNGWNAKVMDNCKGNARLCEVYGFETDQGSVFSHDMEYLLKSDGTKVVLEYTEKQLKAKRMFKELDGLMKSAHSAHYILHIKVLGFKELVNTSPHRVEELFKIIASVRGHLTKSFEAIVSSDTIVVYNVDIPGSDDARQSVVMSQCDFFWDLMHRVAGRSITLRAVLTYGQELTQVIHSEKSLEFTGLIMDHHCLRYNKYYSCRPFDDNWYYVFVTRALDRYEAHWGAYYIPLPDDIDLLSLGLELETLAFSLKQSRNNKNPKLRAKHIATIKQYRSRYPKIFAALESADFRMEAVTTEFDWSKIREGMSWKYDDV